MYNLATKSHIHNTYVGLKDVQPVIMPYNKTIIDFHGGKYRVILTPYSLRYRPPKVGHYHAYGVNITLYLPLGKSIIWSPTHWYNIP